MCLGLVSKQGERLQELETFRQKYSYINHIRLNFLMTKKLESKFNEDQKHGNHHLEKATIKMKKAKQIPKTRKNGKAFCRKLRESAC